MTVNNAINANSVTPLPAVGGGTGVSNVGTWTNAGNVSFGGAHTFTGTLTANTAITFPASGTLVTGGPNSTITNLTGLTGVLQAPTFINDSSSNAFLKFTSVASAVNYFEIVNNMTGNPPALISNGTDVNVGMTLVTKGIGVFALNTTASSNAINFSTGTAYQHLTQLQFSNTSATRSVTFPDASGILTLLGNSSTGSGNIVLATSPTLTTPTLGAASATSINFGGSTLSTYTTGGTFTPVLTSSGGGTATYNVQAGNYSQIGNMLFFTLFLNLTGLPSSGNVTITGLPVNAGSYATFSMSYGGLNVTAVTELQSYVSSGASVIQLFKYAGGTQSLLTVADMTSGAQLIISGAYLT